MQIARTGQELTEAIRSLRAPSKTIGGKTIGLVPTMGALHAGHVSLVEIARREADAVVASVFVNPTQFGPNEDFSKYPRTEKEDVEKLEAAGVAIAYLPTVQEMYPEGFVTKVTVPGISNELDGAFRPGHFDGVATVVSKLFMQVTPDVAVFGEKDYQQLHIIKQFTRDLDIPVRIIGAPIMREADGLAMSSRNRYLSGQERAVAAALYKTLKQTVKRLAATPPHPDPLPAGEREAEAKAEAGEGGWNAILKQAKAALLSAGFTKIDYLEARDADTLAPAQDFSKPARLLAAAWLGKTRLIDNVMV